MQLSNKKILVTGADGFIGSHLVETLISRDYEVRAFVWYNSNNSWGWLDTLPQHIKNNLDVFAGDIRDPHGVKQAMQGINVIMHLAALIAIPYSYHFPHSYIETNVQGTLNLLQAAREANVEKFLQTSTSEVYGTAQFVPITEQHPLQAQSPYAASKIGADQIALSFFRSFELPVTIVRPFNTYGPRQSARAIIPTTITQIAKGNSKIQLGSLHPTRDFNFIQDTVDAFIAIAESDSTIGETINIGSNFEVSMRDTVQFIAEIMNKSIDIVADPSRIRPEQSEVNRLYACNAKVKQLTEWQPQYSKLDGFKRGLQKTIEWFLNPLHLSFYKADRYNI